MTCLTWAQQLTEEHLDLMWAVVEKVCSHILRIRSNPACAFILRVQLNMLIMPPVECWTGRCPVGVRATMFKSCYC